MFVGFEPYCAARGLDYDGLLQAAGLDRRMLAEPDTDIPLNAAATLLHLAAERTSDPCLGLHWATALAQKVHAVLGYLLANARSVRDGVRAISRYVALHIDDVELSFEEIDSKGILRWRFSPQLTAPRVQYASFCMALVIIRLRHNAGATWMPMGVYLEHRPLPCQDDVLRILGPNVHYDCHENALHIRESVLDRSSPDADHRLFDLIRQLGDRLLAERKAKLDIALQTQQAIVRCLDVGETTLDCVAERLGLSEAMLQSRLAASGTTFEALLQETRLGLAEIYLRDTDLPLTEIALLLGFSELSAFTRAASRWFGMPPSHHRVRLRRGQSQTEPV